MIYNCKSDFGRIPHIFLKKIANLKYSFSFMLSKMVKRCILTLKINPHDCNEN